MLDNIYKPHREGLGLESLSMDLGPIVNPYLKQEVTQPVVLTRIGPNFPMDVDQEQGAVVCGLSQAEEDLRRGILKKMDEIHDDMTEEVQRDIAPNHIDHAETELEEDEAVVVAELNQQWMKVEDGFEGWRLARYGFSELDEDEYEYHQW